MMHNDLSIHTSPKKLSKIDDGTSSTMNRTMNDGWKTHAHTSTLEKGKGSISPNQNQTLSNPPSKLNGHQTSFPATKRNLQTMANSRQSMQRSPNAVLQNAWGFSQKKLSAVNDLASESGLSYAVPSKFGQSTKQINEANQNQDNKSRHVRSSTIDNSAREMALMGLTKKQEFGVDGYNMRDYNPYLDKPRNTKIWPGKKTTYLDEAVKNKQFIPPAHYEIMGSLNKKNGKSGLSKSPRNTLAMEAEQFAKRETRPSPNEYNPKHKIVEPRLKGCFNFKCQRNGHIEDAQHQSAEKPSSVSYKSNFRLVEKVAPSPKFNPISKHKSTTPFGTFKQATHLISPTSYQNNESYKKSQLAAPKFYISSCKGQSLVERAIRSKKHVPGSGTYNPDKGYNLITKGASKGWK